MKKIRNVEYMGHLASREASVRDTGQHASNKGRPILHENSAQHVRESGWCLGHFSGFYVPLRSSASYRKPSLQLKYQTTGVNYTCTITVCCNRTGSSQHCLPASVKARELNLKCVRKIGELNPGPFTPSAECVTTRPTGRQH